ncbi:MAG: N-formylglutamate amidohydrolase [Candidatus Peribacteraceae bacterium]|nr:N-formylglutamate amidohydrolase [Candidatus Peribacteria bacterium]
MKHEELVVSIPHAGTNIPTDIRALMPHADETLLQEPDLYTDRIYAVPGIRTVTAAYSRIISDPNRAPDEIYTEGRDRALGVVMLSQAHGMDVFAQDPSLATMQSWIQRFHETYHADLRSAMQTASFLIDGHSMWSVNPPAHPYAGEPRPDIVLGNCHYCSCTAETTKFFLEYFESLGYSVAVNTPFPGRYIVGSYCSRHRTPGIQIEINRALYLDEDTLEPRDDAIAKLHEQFTNLLDAFCTWDDQHAAKRMTDMSA